MPVSECPWFNQNGTPRYYGTYLATKRLDKESGHYLVSITAALTVPNGQGPSIGVQDLFCTYRARNADSLDVVAVLEENRVRIWDNHIRNSSETGAQALREGRYSGGDGFVYPINAIRGTILIPAPFVEKLRLKRDLIVSACYDDFDPGETFCIHKPGAVEKILKKYTKASPAHQR